MSSPLTVGGSLPLDEATRNEVRTRLGRRLKNFASLIDRVSVRFEDANGPRGGIDTVCRLNLVLPALPTIVVETRATDPLLALARAAEAAVRSVARALRKAERAGAGRDRRTPAVASSPAGRRDDEGSLIGRRVGRGKDNLARALDRPEKRRGDAYVDTAAPGTSATQRRAGYGATAARNTKLNTAGMTATLEDSRTTPSRKSTRKSKNRSKSATLLERKAQLRLQKPSARAARGAQRGQ